MEKSRYINERKRKSKNHDDNIPEASYILMCVWYMCFAFENLYYIPLSTFLNAMLKVFLLNLLLNNIGNFPNIMLYNFVIKL